MPPVQFDDEYYHVNIKFAKEHIPYRHVEILIEDDSDNIVEIFCHPPKTISKTGSYYIISGESLTNELIEVEILSKNISYGFQSYESNIYEKTISANNRYDTVYATIEYVNYILGALTLSFAAIIVLIYYFYGKEKSYVVPKYLNYIPKKRKPWIVNLVFGKKAMDFDENGFYATLLNLHIKNVITITKDEKEELKILLNKTKLELDNYENRLMVFLKRWSIDNMFSREHLETSINFFSSRNSYSQLHKIKNDLDFLMHKPKTKVSKQFVTNGRKIPLMITAVGFFIMFIVFILTGISIFYGGPSLHIAFSFSFIFLVQALIMLCAPPSLFGKWKGDCYKEKLEWDAFRCFLSDMAHLKKYDFESIIIWKEWLVYATALGVGKEVAKSMKNLNINIREIEFVPVIYHSFNHVNSTLLASSQRYGSYGGRGYSGGFSGGGGFGGGRGFGGGGAGGR